MHCVQTVQKCFCFLAGRASPVSVVSPDDIEQTDRSTWELETWCLVLSLFGAGERSAKRENPHETEKEREKQSHNSGILCNDCKPHWPLCVSWCRAGRIQGLDSVQCTASPLCSSAFGSPPRMAHTPDTWSSPEPHWWMMHSYPFQTLDFGSESCMKGEMTAVIFPARKINIFKAWTGNAHNVNSESKSVKCCAKIVDQFQRDDSRVTFLNPPCSLFSLGRQLYRVIEAWNDKCSHLGN